MKGNEKENEKKSIRKRRKGTIRIRTRRRRIGRRGRGRSYCGSYSNEPLYQLISCCGSGGQ